MQMRSPDELHAFACNVYGIDKPHDPREWNLVVNTWACNIEKGFEVVICQTMAKLYDCPFPPEYIEKIALFQQSKK